MLRRKVVEGLILAVLAAGLSSCGSGSSSTPTVTTPKTGAVAILIGDDPACDILSFRSTITGANFRPQGGGDNALIFSSDPFIFVNFAALKDTSAVLHIGTVNVGTYDSMELDFSVNQVALFDSTASPPIANVDTNEPAAPSLVTIDPPLVVTDGGVSGVKIDLDLAKSITFSSAGTLTPAFKPVVKAHAITPGADGFGKVEDLYGFVLSVTNQATAGTDFTGSFALQTLSGSSQVPIFTISMKADTELDGVSALNQMPGGAFVEVNGYVDANGNIVARSVQVEQQENSLVNRLALIGPVLSVKRDSSGNATSFVMLAAEEQPEIQFALPLHSTVTINLSSSTFYDVSAKSVNFASLPYDAASIAPGQVVVAHGEVTQASDGTFSMPATAVYLKLQTHQGNLSSIIKVGSDNRTGAFFMTPCEGIFAGTNIMVITNYKTTFVNTSGLGALTTQPTLLVKGLLFLDHPGGTILGATVPPDTLVMIANQVHVIL